MTVTKELTAPTPAASPPVELPAAPPLQLPDKPPSPQQQAPGLFSRITRGKQGGPHAIGLYGSGGVGKSYLASNAPNPIFLPTEDGLRDINCNAFPLLKSLGDVLSAIGELYSQPHDFMTVVIDSLDWLEPLIWNHVCAKYRKESIEKFPYGEGYKHAVTEWRNILEGLDALRAKRGMTVILIAHAQIKRFESPETDAYERYQPKLQNATNVSAMATIVEWCDEVLFASYEVFTRKVEEGMRERNIGIGTGDRILRTVERPFCIAKNRLNMPEKIPMSWSEIAKYLPGA